MSIKVIELGGGTNPKYHPNLDKRPLPTVDRVWDGEKERIPYPSNTLDLVYTSHLIEHLYRSTQARLFKEIYRVLKPGGTLHLFTPDLKQLCELYLKKGNLVERLRGSLFGGQMYPLDIHKHVWDVNALTTILKGFKFHIVKVETRNIGETGGPELEIVARK